MPRITRPIVHVTITPIDTPDTCCWIVSADNEACNEHFMNEDYDSLAAALHDAFHYCRNHGLRMTSRVAPTVTDPEELIYN